MGFDAFQNRVMEMANVSTEAVVEIHSEDGDTYDVRVHYIVVGAPASTTREKVNNHGTVSHNLTHPNSLI
jgi:carbonic anhydrase/acetyltransferase-like protein (isoleucine patch superfamily)